MKQERIQRVTFVCTLGEFNSPYRLGVFQQYLKENGLDGKFELRSTGISSPGSEQIILNSDHVISILPEIEDQLRELVSRNKLPIEVHPHLIFYKNSKNWPQILLTRIKSKMKR